MVTVPLLRNLLEAGNDRVVLAAPQTRIDSDYLKDPPSVIRANQQRETNGPQSDMGTDLGHASLLSNELRLSRLNKLHNFCNHDLTIF